MNLPPSPDDRLPRVVVTPDASANTYTVKEQCDNCRHDFVLVVPKGQPRPYRATCPVCGCEAFLYRDAWGGLL